ncbi:MAG: phosphatase PAP2 family protein [Acidimicrobiales bacterium]
MTPDTHIVSGPTDERTLRWWLELGLIGTFYFVYSWVRNQFGSAVVDPAEALANANRIIDIEEAVGLYFEPTVQGWFLGWEWFLRFWNIFYGTLHFVVTPVALGYLYWRYPRDYPRYRTVGLFTTGLAIIGFALFPLMPPRLMGNCGTFGGCVEDSPYVDTMAEIGGIWSFDSEAIASISNQYAAMPSLHFAWSFWCFLVLYPRMRRRSLRVAIALYPWLTVFAIVVTANHFWIDAVGGAAVLASGFLLGNTLTGFLQRRGLDRGVAAAAEASQPPPEEPASGPLHAAVSTDDADAGAHTAGGVPPD